MVGVEKMPEVSSTAPNHFSLANSITARKLEIIILAIIGVIVLALVFGLRWTWLGDDAVYRNFAATDGQFGGSLPEFLDHRLNNWTSRALIEATIFTVINQLFWWRIGTAIAFWLVVVMLPFLITNNVNHRIILLPISGLLVLAIPTVVWFGAGFIATTLNYLWPFAATLLAAAPAILLLQRRAFNPLWYLVAVPAAIFAGSAEILAGLLAVLFAATLGWMFYRMRSIGHATWSVTKNGLIILGLMLVYLIGQIIYHLQSPGNAARQLTNWSFDPLPVIIERSFSSTLRQIFMSAYAIPVVFFTVVAVKTVLNRRPGGSIIPVIISTVPIIGSFLLRDAFIPGTLGSVIQNQFNFGNLLWNPFDPALPSTFDAPSIFAFISLTFLLLAAISAVVTASFEPPRMVIILITLAAGFGSKFVVANTVGAGLEDVFHRTDLYLLFAFLIATLIAVGSMLPTSGTGVGDEIHI